MPFKSIQCNVGWTLNYRLIIYLRAIYGLYIYIHYQNTISAFYLLMDVVSTELCHYYATIVKIVSLSILKNFKMNVHYSHVCRNEIYVRKLPTEFLSCNNGPRFGLEILRISFNISIVFCKCRFLCLLPPGIQLIFGLCNFTVAFIIAQIWQCMWYDGWLDSTIYGRIELIFALEKNILCWFTKTSDQLAALSRA